jgi:hypothetical protein
MLNMKHRSHSRYSSRRAAAGSRKPHRLNPLCKRAAIDRSQVGLSATHHRYHLSRAEALTKDQAKRYAQLRSYAGERKARIILRIIHRIITDEVPSE